MIKIVRYTAIGLITLAALFLLWQFNIFIILLLSAMATSAAYKPIIDKFTKRFQSKNMAILVVYSVSLVLITALGLVLIPPLIRDLEELSGELARSYEIAKSTWPESGTIFQRTLAEGLPAIDELYTSLAGERGSELTQSLLGAAANTFDFAGKLVLIFFVSAYWSADSIRFERLWLSMISADKRIQARSIWQDIESRVGEYIRREVMLSLLAGFLLWACYLILGLKYPVLLSVVGAFTWLIPWLGALLAATPPLLVGLGTSTVFGLSAFTITVAILFSLEILVHKRFSFRQRYSSLLLVVVAVILFESFGIVGLIVAPPLSAAIEITISHLFNLPHNKVSKELIDQIADLEKQSSQIESQLIASQEEPPAHIMSLARRLRQLVERTRNILIPE